METEIDKKLMLRQCKTAEFVESFKKPTIATVEVSWIDLTLKFDDV